MAAQEPPAILPLIKEQSDRITFLKAQCVPEPVFQDHDLLRRHRPQDGPGRYLRFTDLAGQEFVAGALQRKKPHQLSQPPPLPLRQAAFRLRQQEIAQSIHIPPRPTVRRAMHQSIRVALSRIHQGQSQSQAWVRRKIHRRTERNFPARRRMF